MKLLRFALSMVATFGTISATSIPKETKDQLNAKNVDITPTELVRFSEGINIAKTNESYSMGENPFRIFNHNSDGFEDLFVATDNTLQISDSVKGSSKSEISSNYNSKFGLNLSVSSEATYPPIGSVSASVDTNFDTTINKSLTNIKDEYFEFYEVYKQVKVVTVDWLSKDLSTYFNPAMISDLEKINNVFSAKSFLEKYGTHVFNNYYLGGTLIITNHIVSEQSIKDVYTETNTELSLKASVSGAAKGATSSDIQSTNIEGENVNNETTKSAMNMRSFGGKNLNGITIDGLFTYNQEYVTTTGSGYVYKAWLNSLDNEEALRVIKVANPVSIWDILKASSYYDLDRQNLLKKAYEVLIYQQYADRCAEIGKDAGYFKDITYNSSSSSISFNVTNNNIRLPDNVSAKFTYGSYITNNLDLNNVKLLLDNNYSYARLVNNELIVDKNSLGKSLKLSIDYLDNKIYELTIYIAKGSFNKGYGTTDQPYLIDNESEWLQFITSSDYLTSNSHYKLRNDINLKGKNIEPAGTSRNVDFNGYLDGDNHSITNGSVIAQGKWNCIGLFGSNSGTICNLKLENIVVTNSGILCGNGNADIYAGILAGINSGVLSNILVINCKIRFSSNLKNNSNLYVGGLVGCSRGNIELCGVNGCYIFGQTYEGDGFVSVGGILGLAFAGNVSNSYAINSNLTSRNIGENKATKKLGAAIGYCKNYDNLKPDIKFVLTYLNNFDHTDGEFGYMAGNSSSSLIFNNCYYESVSEKSVNGSHFDGCYCKTTLTLANINNSEMYNLWTNGKNGKPILICHSKEN